MFLPFGYIYGYTIYIYIYMHLTPNRKYGKRVNLKTKVNLVKDLSDKRLPLSYLGLFTLHTYWRYAYCLGVQFGRGKS